MFTGFTHTILSHFIEIVTFALLMINGLNELGEKLGGNGKSQQRCKKILDGICNTFLFLEMHLMATV